MTGKPSLDLSDRELSISVFVPEGSRIRRLEFAFRLGDLWISVPTHEEKLVKGRWYHKAINLKEAATNPLVETYMREWKKAIPCIKGCEILSVMADMEEGSSGEGAVFLIDDFAWSPWAEPEARDDVDSLRKYAPHGMYIGPVIQEHFFLQPAFLRTLRQEFNYAFPLRGLHPCLWPDEEPAEPAAMEIDYSIMDSLVGRAIAHGLSPQLSLPGWCLDVPKWLCDLPIGVVGRYLERRVDMDLGRYAGKTVLVEVFNEILTHSGDRLRNRQSVDASQEPRWSPYGYNFSPWVDGNDCEIIDAVFRRAREVDPGTKLILNDFLMHSDHRSAKSEYLYRLVSGMKARGVPIDGVGLQFHLYLDGRLVGFDKRPTIGEFLCEVERDVRRYAAKEFLVEFTEMEVAIRIDDLDMTTDRGRKIYARRLLDQADMFAGLMKIAKEYDNVVAFNLWQISDTWSTRWDKYAPDNYPEMRAYDDGALFDSFDRPKPAYYAILKVLKGK
jgi:endo-1,4-beta-xylanase